MDHTLVIDVIAQIRAIFPSLETAYVAKNCVPKLTMPNGRVMLPRQVILNGIGDSCADAEKRFVQNSAKDLIFFYRQQEGITRSLRTSGRFYLGYGNLEHSLVNQQHFVSCTYSIAAI